MRLRRGKASSRFEVFTKDYATTDIIPPLRGVSPISSTQANSVCKHLQSGARNLKSVIVRENTPRTPLKRGIILWRFAMMFSLLFASCLLPSTSFSQSSTSDSLRAQEPIASALIKSPKSPNGAVLRSLLVPGWGQYYNGQKWKAALVCAAEIGEVGTAIYWHRAAQRVNDARYKLIYEDYRNAAYWFLAGTIVLSMLDAYVDAQLSDFDESPDLDNRTLGELTPSQPLFVVRIKIRL